MTEQQILAAAQDHGTRRMRAAGRERWNRADWNAAARYCGRLLKQHALLGEYVTRCDLP